MSSVKIELVFTWSSYARQNEAHSSLAILWKTVRHLEIMMGPVSFARDI